MVISKQDLIKFAGKDISIEEIIQNRIDEGWIWKVTKANGKSLIPPDGRKYWEPIWVEIDKDTRIPQFAIY